jgi:hypothetical protein
MATRAGDTSRQSTRPHLNLRSDLSQPGGAIPRYYYWYSKYLR